MQYRVILKSWSRKKKREIWRREFEGWRREQEGTSWILLTVSTADVGLCSFSSESLLSSTSGSEVFKKYEVMRS